MLDVEKNMIQCAATGYASGTLGETPDVVVDLLHQKYSHLDKDEIKEVFEEGLDTFIGRK